MSDPDETPRSLDGLSIGPSRSTSRWRLLVVLGGLETVTLVVLLLNLGLIGHHPQLARMIGPIHGCLHAAGKLLTWTGPFSRGVKWLAPLPMVGIWSAAVHARRRARSVEPATQ